MIEYFQIKTRAGRRIWVLDLSPSLRETAGATAVMRDADCGSPPFSRPSYEHAHFFFALRHSRG
jgi:hypothetical protein